MCWLSSLKLWAALIWNINGGPNLLRKFGHFDKKSLFNDTKIHGETVRPILLLKMCARFVFIIPEPRTPGEVLVTAYYQCFVPPCTDNGTIHQVHFITSNVSILATNLHFILYHTLWSKKLRYWMSCCNAVSFFVPVDLSGSLYQNATANNAYLVIPHNRQCVFLSTSQYINILKYCSLKLKECWL